MGRQAVNRRGRVERGLAALALGVWGQSSLARLVCRYQLAGENDGRALAWTREPESDARP